MTRHRSMLLALALSLSCCLPVVAAPQEASSPGPAPQAAAAQDPAAQDAASQAPEGVTVIRAEDLELHYYPATRVRANDLAEMLEGLLARRIAVRSPTGEIGEPVRNVRLYRQTLVLSDLPERVAAMTKLLGELEAGLEPADQPEGPAPLQVTEYVPRHLRIENLIAALQTFRRDVPPLSGSGVHVPNLSWSETPALIVMRDAPEVVQQMLDLLARVDVAPRQLVITCWLIGGTDTVTPSPLPAELVENLKQLVPFAGFERLSTAVVRSTVEAGQDLMLNGDFLRMGKQERFELKLRPAAYDPQRRVFSLSRCRFEATTGQQFETGAVIEAGEYVVIGASGSDPLFVVLRVMPVEG